MRKKNLRNLLYRRRGDTCRTIDESFSSFKYIKNVKVNEIIIDSCASFNVLVFDLTTESAAVAVCDRKKALASALLTSPL